MNLNEFLNSNWGLIDIGAYLHGAEVNGLYIKERRNKKGLELFQHFKIIPRWDNLPNCPRCNGQLRKYVDRSQTVGWGLRCAANHRFQPTKNTFLERLQLKTFGADIIIGAMWSVLRKYPQKDVIKDHRTHTAVEWFNFFRDVMTKIAWYEYVSIGGPDDVVEVDESHLFKRKDNRGRVLMWDHVWVLGGVSRTTGRVFAVTVHDRTQNTLIKELMELVDFQSYVCTDHFRSYNFCVRHFNGHGVVNHSHQFLNPVRTPRKSRYGFLHDDSRRSV
ncbi:isxo2-like transposase domain [Holotrichia oblita]|uniref:Isxo2-like transposase domain n=1 Tax=Holotrichia oblita TaxID=644536 RepID=A0ACB9T931_HOLOL|nr:isxo2-like transposase domain [Holotrichia oblita]